MYLKDTENKINGLGLEDSGARLLPEGTVFLSRTASVGFSGIMDKEMATSQDFANWVCGDQVVSEYLVYIFRSMDQEFSRLMQGSTHQTIYMPDIESLQMPLPPVEEQQKIASYLNDNVKKIYDLIQKKESLMDILEEKQQAVITQTVTEGVDSDLGMEDSEIEWLDEVPIPCDVTKLKYIVQSDTPVYGILKPGPEVEDGIPYIGAGDIVQGRLSIDELPRTSPEIAEEYQRTKMNSGELVYAIRGSYGDVEVLPEELSGVNLSRDAARISPKDNIDSEWLCWALKSEIAQQQVELSATGSAVNGVNIGDLKQLILPVPPIKEQKEIAAYLNDFESKISQLRDAIEEEITLLQEKRQALIWKTVTGKIDLAEWQQHDSIDISL
ncbi:restriction endonuclease subunit S [Natronococcus wangiae]|uniref:restriction endonuclease subunit S n=1 Tax=Natronococcus wangiae TaxID=3068275 RepID=UPI00273EF6A3|nr:restriction endonuclease subunit S [Natronococcus sp. AD5]